jgi:CDP-diglyceride synthetase
LTIENLIQISVMLEYYNMTVENKRYKNLKKLITLNYLLSWSYILIMSGTMELTMKLIEVLSIYNNIENPFIN